MSPSPSQPPPERASEPAALLLAFGGLAAAFGVAACCALPLGLATLGLGTAWLGGIALAAAPYQGVLMGLSAASLLGAAALVARSSRRPACLGGVCARSPLRSLATVGLLAGAVLLGAAYAVG
jgi:mercuric ion transport protein